MNSVRDKRFLRLVAVVLLMCLIGTLLGCSSKEEPEDNKTEQSNKNEQGVENEQSNKKEQVTKKSFEDSIELPYLGGKKYVNQVARGSGVGGNGAQPFEFETGYFAYYQDDYDNDGSGEILLLTLHSQGVGEASIITYMMYEEGEEGWERAAAFDLQMENQGEKYWWDFLYKKVNGVPYFFQEFKQISTYFSDGMTWKLNGIKYEDGYFKQMEGKISFAGSDTPELDYLAKPKEEFAAVGLNIGNIDYEQHAFDLSAGIIKLANIQSDLNAEFYELNQSELGEAYCVDGIDIVISDYTRAGMRVAQEDNAGNNEYVLPESNTSVLARDNIINLSANELRIARNEILARHNRKFNDVELQAYFESKSWYTGMILPDEFDDSVLNACEAENIKLIQAREQELQ